MRPTVGRRENQCETRRSRRPWRTCIVSSSGLSPAVRGRAAVLLALALSCMLSLGACSSDGASEGAAQPSASTAADTSPAAKAVQAGLDKHVEGDLDGASADYAKALESDPDNILALYNLGLIAQTEGDDLDAEKRYRSVLENDPEYQPAVFNLAIIRKAARDNAEAEQLYRRAISLRPGDAGAHLNLGLLLRETGQTLMGDAEVATALKLNPELVDPAKAGRRTVKVLP